LPPPDPGSRPAGDHFGSKPSELYLDQQAMAADLCHHGPFGQI
jgi:hypothetical protein